MTNIEQKALELVNEVSDGYHDVTSIYDIHTAKARRSALCRAIEQHEAFRQEVSDAIVFALKVYGGHSGMFDPLRRFIIAKPDPLVEAWDETWAEPSDKPARLETFRAALAKRGGRIVFDD